MGFLNLFQLSPALSECYQFGKLQKTHRHLIIKKKHKKKCSHRAKQIILSAGVVSCEENRRSVCKQFLSASMHKIFEEYRMGKLRSFHSRELFENFDVPKRGLLHGGLLFLQSKVKSKINHK